MNEHLLKQFVATSMPQFHEVFVFSKIVKEKVEYLAKVLRRYQFHLQGRKQRERLLHPLRFLLSGRFHKNGGARNHLLERVAEAPPSSFLFSKRSTMSSCAGFFPYGGKTSKPTRLVIDRLPG
jgi:hypothetical protein